METHQEAPAVITNIDSSDRDSYSLQSNATWDILYHSIGSLVRIWVRSSHIPLWHGQEEEVAADIVQETMLRTFTYASDFSSWTQEGKDAPSQSLENICKAIAYTQYRDLRHQDSRFIRVRSCKYSYPGCSIMRERFDPLETAINDTFQEWCCTHLASEIADIPIGPRTELLIYLANHVCFDLQISQLLQNAFLKRGIRLQEYRRSLPGNHIARSRHKTLLQMAHKRVMRKQEKLKKLEHPAMVPVNQKLALTPGDLAADIIVDDPELRTLAAELEATAPFAIVDPAFRQILGNKLLDIQTEYHASNTTINPEFRQTLRNKLIAECTSIHNVSALPDFFLNKASEIILEKKQKKVNYGQLQNPAPGDSEADPTGYDLGLTILLACLHTTVAFTDPSFQCALQDKIVDNPLLDYAASSQ
jgi:hypothetical protein